MRRRLRRSCAQMTACKIRQMVPLSGRILRSPASSRVFDSASALRPDLRLPRQGPLGSRSGEATGCHQSMWAGPGSSAQAVRKLSPSAGSTLADRGVLDGWPLPQSLVGRVRDGLRPSGRRGSDQCLYLWRVSEADHRRSRAEPWGVFCGSDGSRDDRWGARRIMLPGLLLYALATVSYGLLQASPLLLSFLIFVLTGLVGGVQSPIPYAAVIAQWFDRERDLALGIGTAGVGLGVALVPQVA